jgi:hypothetical protein
MAEGGKSSKTWKVESARAGICGLSVEDAVTTAMTSREFQYLPDPLLQVSKQWSIIPTKLAGCTLFVYK